MPTARRRLADVAWLDQKMQLGFLRRKVARWKCASGVARDSAHLCTRATPPIDLRHWRASEGKSAVRRAIRTSPGKVSDLHARATTVFGLEHFLRCPTENARPQKQRNRTQESTK